MSSLYTMTHPKFYYILRPESQEKLMAVTTVRGNRRDFFASINYADDPASNLWYTNRELTELAPEWVQHELQAVWLDGLEN